MPTVVPVGKFSVLLGTVGTISPSSDILEASATPMREEFIVVDRSTDTTEPTMPS